VRDILDLILTLFVLLLVWVVPRLALESRRRKQRAGKKVPARAVPDALPDAAAAAREDLYDWDEKAAESWLERQRGAETSPQEQAVRPADTASLEETVRTTPDYYSHEVSPAGRVPSENLRRRALRQAVIWKEILDPPRALHPDPFL
jgi:hypothetical protein